MLIPTHPQNLTDQFIDQQNSSQISQFSFINLTLVSISESIKHENLAKKAMFIFSFSWSKNIRMFAISNPDGIFFFSLSSSLLVLILSLVLPYPA